MQIISIDFALFVLVVLAVYYLLPGRLQKIWLLLASYYFYYTWDWKYCAVLLAVTLLNFGYAHWLIPGQASTRRRLWLGILVNLSVFAFFLGKEIIELYGPRALARIGLPEVTLALFFPIGFSYYILNCIAYLVDVSRRQYAPVRNVLDFALYLAYFPKLLSGPIERAQKFISQFDRPRRVDADMVSRSFMLIFVGLFRSVFIGGILIVLAPTQIRLEPAEFSALQQIVYFASFGFALYNQFCGYSDIVRGVSGLLGIELTRNFATPVFSKDLSDFWVRWHISLSQWFRDYIYFPASRFFLRRNPSRMNFANLILPPVITMMASGIWHGGSGHLLVWGAFNGALLVGEQTLTLFRKIDPSVRPSFWRRAAGRAVILIILYFATLPFFLNLAGIYQSFAGLSNFVLDDLSGLLPIVLLMALSVLVDWLQYAPADEFVFLKWPRWAQSVIMALVFYAVLIGYKIQNALPQFIYP